MSPRHRGPIVADTGVYGAALVPGSPLGDRFEPVLLGRPVFISFQTAAELRYGGLLRSWGPARMLALEARIAAAEVVHSGPDLVSVWAQLRVDCHRAGHALAAKAHVADLWIAATAVRLGVPLATDDGIFTAVPGLQLEAPA